MIEATDSEACDDCGLWVDACRLGARTAVEGRLVVARGDCYGCALCVDVCPRASVRMVPRG
jgi:MinD superfamily P-loop ATPase